MDRFALAERGDVDHGRSNDRRATTVARRATAGSLKRLSVERTS